MGLEEVSRSKWMEGVSIRLERQRETSYRFINAPVDIMYGYSCQCVYPISVHERALTQRKHHYSRILLKNNEAIKTLRADQTCRRQADRRIEK